MSHALFQEDTFMHGNRRSIHHSCLLVLGLFMTACGTASVPAGNSAALEMNSAGQSKVTAQAGEYSQGFGTTWAGGRCSFQQWWATGSNGYDLYQVGHRNGGQVRLNIKMWPPYDPITWSYKEKVGFAESSVARNMRVEVYAYCKVDGNWVGGLKYSTN
ncbi:hypothetical protein GO986_20550 [Deinococcus sp. HMF7620]|uniref:Uncharacterized protein n=1 Tax=Deinococcus arboris TaxID=2682977 RepID=A0A7C9HU60_9DEIO|nr:hypothetical protein [Deinococcus arboris]MVN89132.1 hypothetical protein [Deinococcus arboris]